MPRELLLANSEKNLKRQARKRTLEIRTRHPDAVIQFSEYEIFNALASVRLYWTSPTLATTPADYKRELWN